jgi:DHA1 family bicyclomycin/chloramphenicol resistance-like MFS transporter
MAMSRIEFISLCAMMFATIAFSIDAMLPALPQIGAELSPSNLNNAQLLLTSFILGMGLGTFFTGPLSDTFGRKPVIIAGSAIYILSSLLAWWSQSLELVLIARFIQGVGAAGPRVATIAIVRDLFKGREMAQLMSYTMMVFMLVPAIAPALGAAIIAISGWRSIFIAFIVFSVISILWIGLRLPEPLSRENRRPFRLSQLILAAREMWHIPSVRLTIAVQVLGYGTLFAMISTVQQIYDITFDQGDSFPLWFGAIAILSGSAGLLNASLVMRYGMRFLVTATLGVQIIFSAVMLGLNAVLPTGDLLFGIFVIWQASVFFQIGMTIGNLNALGMEPMGHMAGTAASVMGAITTIAGAGLAVPVGLAFNGTLTPLALAIGVEAALGFLLMLWLRRIEQAA